MTPNTTSFIDTRRVTLTKEKLDALYDLVGQIYLADDRPWVIGYSGGKDSTAVLQLIWYALQRLPVGRILKPVFVIASDTLVETPVIVGHITKTLARINEAAAKQNLPITAHKVVPEVDDTFWVNLIGRGYPAPYNRFRWCTDRMKIKPATKFILDQIGRFGEVVLLLGARKSESATRSQVMNNRRKVGDHLSRHTDISGAWVFTPVEDWQTEDVWTYLLNAPSPWGNQNRDLVTMYRNAQAGECPLVVDTSTPSCGNSRFGCWTCTVVQQDKTMAAMIDSGEDWLEPMLQFRNWLADTQDPARKAEIRDVKRRDGRVHERKIDGKTVGYVPGPYLLSFRREILRRLLDTQKEVRRRSAKHDEVLIIRAELDRIRQIWRLEEGDWEDSLPQIYFEATGEEVEWADDDWSGMGAAEQELLHRIAGKHKLDPDRLTELFDLEREMYGMSRRSQIYTKIDTVFSKDWRTRDQVIRLHVLDADTAMTE